MNKFKLVAPYQPMGDQIEAIKHLTQNIELGISEQTLLGATGTGKTFTIANVIANVNKPTIVLAHNKTLAGQLYAELKSLFPENRVEYFISYYDYYQPEAYVPSKDMYIEKDSSINDEIDQMRHSATQSILERRDTIIVASVSCIYGIGDPEDYENSMLVLRKAEHFKRDILLEKLVSMQFVRNNINFERGTFRVKGDNVDILPTSESNNGIRVTFFDDEIEAIKKIDVETQMSTEKITEIEIFPLYEIYYEKSQIEDIKKRILKDNELSDRISIALENIENYQNLEQLYMYMPYIANSYQPLIRLIEKPICFYEDYQSCLEHEKAMMIEISEYLIQTKAKVEQNFFVQLKEVLYDSKLNIFTSLFRNALNDVKLDYHYPLETLNCFEYNNNIRSMLEDLKANINKRYLIRCRW